jgi:FAD/FMN-containing dehydrogenase
MAVADHISSGLRTLRALSSGGVIGRGEPGYDEARRAWAAAADLNPAAVAQPENETDMAFAVAFARETRLRVNVQATGHNASPLGDMSDTLLVRTDRMNAVEIDFAGRRARVGAGAMWQDVVPRASDLGLAALHGSSPNVGIVGYSLGGGIGYLARRHGLQANSVTAVELVTGEGDLVRADAHNEPDLFWALRGGGGNFGAVTALEFRLYPIATVYAGMMAWPIEQAERVIGRWAEWTSGLTEDVTSMMRMLRVPDIDGVPDFLRGREIALLNAAYAGDEADGIQLLAPMRDLGPQLDMFATMPVGGLAGLHGDPEESVPGETDTTVLESLPAAAVEAFVAAANAAPSLMVSELRHLGGAAGRIEEGAGALGRIAGEYVLFCGGIAPDAAAAAQVRRDAGALVDAMAPYGSGGSYLNFAERRVDTSRAYSPAAYARLQAVRADADPDCLFRANHEIV